VNPTKVAETKKPSPPTPPTKPEEPLWPVIDVFTPEGRFIGSRQPLNLYLLNKARTEPAKRLRRSMKGAKKREKMAKRAARAAERAG
jgi:hypothetical protein